MFATPRKIITNTTLIASLLLSGLAQAAATDTCFNFLDAQDYARAESEALQLTKRKNLNREERRAAYLCLGRALTQQGRTQDALLVFQKVEALSQTTKQLAKAYSSLGEVYYVLHDLDHAELYYQRALKAYKESGNQDDEDSALNEASAINNLALVVNSRGDTDRAMELYQEALVLSPNDAATLNNIALIYHARKEYPEAVETIRKGIEITRRQGDAHQTAIFQINLAGILRSQGELQESEKELTTGINAIHLIGDKRWEAGASWQFALLKIAQKDIPTAREWAKKAEVLNREIGNTAEADAIAKQLNGK